MSRYIDAEAFKRRILSYGTPIPFYKRYLADAYVAILRWVCEEVDNTPSANVVEVVRCGECRHYVRSEGVCKLHSNNYEPTVAMEEDDYCSRGRRDE